MDEQAYIQVGDPVAAMREAEAANVTVYRIGLSQVMQKSDLMNAFAAGLELPDHFGRNWDALEECLRDLEIGESAGWLLVFDNAEAILRLPEAEIEILAGVLSGVGSFWAAEGRRFSSLFATADPAAAGQLTALLGKTLDGQRRAV